jgi:tetratricopeptide (TPR) repeat protein
MNRSRVMRAAWVFLSAGICAVAARPAAGDAATSVAGDVARTANERFWSALHGADYGAYPQALAAVEAALAAAPEDPLQNAHLGWLHMWHLAEAGSFGTTPQDMSADLTAAGEYFKRAVTLDPNEARYLGFYATTLVVQSALVPDPIRSRRAEAVLDRAVRMWPEFNLFTAGYIHSSDPDDSPEYSRAVRRMWRNLDVCAGRRVSRVHPDFAKYLPLETTVGPKRACWNSSIAPHNVEGFFLNFGDMLVKQGDVALARAMYVNARLSKTYTEWRYRDVLERRITDAEANVAVFRDSTPSTTGDAHVMVRSNFACMACHRQ